MRFFVPQNDKSDDENPSCLRMTKVLMRYFVPQNDKSVDEILSDLD